MKNVLRGMRGQASATEILMTILLSAAIIALILQVPKIMRDFADLIVFASAEGTARGLAGMITISGAAPDSINIYYTVEDEAVNYDIEIKNRLVHITGIRSGSSNIQIKGGPEAKGWAKIAVSDISDFWGNVGYFVINKTREVAGDQTSDIYEVTAS